MTSNRIKVNIPIAFKPLFTKARYKVFYGGRGSGKSWSLAEFLIVMAYSKPKTRVLCTREIQNSIKESVHKLLADTIERLDLSPYFNITNNSITCLNGSEFIFMGLLRNVDQIKSTEGIDYCWVSEAHNVSDESWEILLPTIRKEDSEILVDFNPRYEDDPTYQRWVVDPPEGTISKLVNHVDNPYFPDVLRIEMEHDKKKDKLLYEQKWLGKPIGIGGKVWPQFEPDTHIKSISMEEIAKRGDCIMAMDPHSHFYPACLWMALIPINERRNFPEDYSLHVYAEWPTLDELSAPYHEQRKKLTYTGDLSDIAREVYARDGHNVKIRARAIDPRFAKGSGGWNWSTSTQGIVGEFAKKSNGALSFTLPHEKDLDVQRQRLQKFMDYNKLAPITTLNMPRFSVDPSCHNLILSLKNHRLEEDPHRAGELKEKESEKYKDFSDCLRIGASLYKGYVDPTPKPKGQNYRPRSVFG